MNLAHMHLPCEPFEDTMHQKDRDQDRDRGCAGVERRRHQMYVTRNTEYHLRDGVCIAVRDRQSGRWQLTHHALNRNISGAVRFNANGDPYPTLKAPEVGEAMFFAIGGPDVVTSCLTAVERPAKDLVSSYPP
jgi:hypothetical protein